MSATKNKVFDLKEVGYTDLDKVFTPISFNQKDFGNALFKNAMSVEMDAFARTIHEHGKAEINAQVKSEIMELAPKLWMHRAASALIETISKL